jgi:nicotinamidase-related amidase
MDEYTRPDPDRAVLLTVDVQNDFTLPGAPGEIPGTAEAVPRMRRLVEAFRAADAPVVHVVRLYRADGSNVDACRRRAVEDGAELVRPGTDGAELVDGLVPAGTALDADLLLADGFQAVGPREWVAYKPRWGAFYDTRLESFLDERGANTVVVCGCNFPNCPRTTVYEASERDYRVVLVPDATSGTYDRGLSELSDVGVATWDAEETVAWLE